MPKRSGEPSASPGRASSDAAPEQSAPAATVTPSDPAKLSTTKKLLGSVPVPDIVIRAALLVAQLGFLGWAIWNAFRIRTYALEEYGFVIHEFDPWFHFRAT